MLTYVVTRCRNKQRTLLKVWKWTFCPVTAKCSLLVPNEANPKLQSKYFCLGTKQRTELEQVFNPKVGHYTRFAYINRVKFLHVSFKPDGVKPTLPVVLKLIHFSLQHWWPTLQNVLFYDLNKMANRGGLPRDDSYANQCVSQSSVLVTSTTSCGYLN
jgi:hypothetical protein